MNDRALDMVYLVGVLAIACSALVARRMSASLLVRSVLAWLLIIAVVAIVVINRHAIAASLGLKLQDPVEDSEPGTPSQNQPHTDPHLT
jgi:hypothetical protein